MHRSVRRGLLPVAVLVAAACGVETPTISDPDSFPVTAVTSEVRIPSDRFASGVRVLGGFGRVSEVALTVVATEFGGDGLDARTLVRFAHLPRAVSVRDTAGTTVTDSALVLVEGRAVLRFDTLASPPTPVTLSASMVRERWHPASATFEHAVDTIGERISWAAAGGGITTPVATAVWDPAESDSVFFPLDTTVIHAWTDTTDATRGMLVRMVTPGARVKVRSVNLVANAIPSVRPDTLVTTDTYAEHRTFVYTPRASAPEGVLQVGGAPAWRTIFEVDLPDSIEIESGCASTRCVFPLDGDGITLAALVLTPAPTDAALRPTGPLFVDARPVYAPERLPRAPLGSSVQLPFPQAPAEIFADEGSGALEIPITGFVRDLARGVTEDSLPAPNTLALLAAVEPESFELMRFFGIGSAQPPVLRILVSQVSGMHLR